jgi:hypothetical protein
MNTLSNHAGFYYFGFAFYFGGKAFSALRCQSGR